LFAISFVMAIVRTPEDVIGEALTTLVLTGGYPEMLRRKSPARRQAWARDYINALVRRDVRDIADVERLEQMARLLRVLAHHSGQLTNFTEIGAQNHLDDKTTKKYVHVLEQLFLIRRVEPWFRNRLKRLVKTPRLHFLDSGLLAAISGITRERIARDRAVFGSLLETFVFSEVLKQSAWLDDRYSISHYRDKDQDDVDLVVENEGDRARWHRGEGVSHREDSRFQGAAKSSLAPRARRCALASCCMTEHTPCLSGIVCLRRRSPVSGVESCGRTGLVWCCQRQRLRQHDNVRSTSVRTRSRASQRSTPRANRSS
jgi:predicted AAA+ superfamily ATPase